MNKQNIKIGQVFRRELIPLGYKNANGRLYDLDAANFIIRSFNKQKELLKFGMFGEIGYPNLNSVDLNNASHVICDLFIEEGVLSGEIKILDTKNGKLLLDNIDNFVFRPLSEGEVKNERILLTKFISFNAVPKSEDSYSDFYSDRKDKYIYDITSVKYTIPVGNLSKEDAEKSLNNLISKTKYRKDNEISFEKEIIFPSPDYSKKAELECIDPKTGEIFIPDFYKNKKKESWFKKVCKKIFKK